MLQEIDMSRDESISMNKYEESAINEDLEGFEGINKQDEIYINPDSSKILEKVTEIIDSQKVLKKYIHIDELENSLFKGFNSNSFNQVKLGSLEQEKFKKREVQKSKEEFDYIEDQGSFPDKGNSELDMKEPEFKAPSHNVYQRYLNQIKSSKKLIPVLNPDSQIEDEDEQ